MIVNNVQVRDHCTTMEAYLVEVGIRKLFARVTSLNAGTVDQNAYLIAISKDLGDEPGHIFGRAQVSGVYLGVSSQSAD